MSTVIISLLQLCNSCIVIVRTA